MCLTQHCNSDKCKVTRLRVDSGSGGVVACAVVACMLFHAILVLSIVSNESHENVLTFRYSL